MEFLAALREAKDSGMSTDDFLKTWHMLNLDDKSQENNLRRGKRVTPPTMANKSKRRGWVSPDTSNIKDPFAEETQDQGTAEENNNIESLKLLVPAALPRQAKSKPVKSPRAVRQRQKAQPPSYEEAQDFKRANVTGPVQLTEQTERKFVNAAGGDSEPSSDEENNTRSSPSALDLQKIDADQQTVPKHLYVNCERRRRKETPSGPYETVDDNILMTKENQALLMNTIIELQAEQEALKVKLREHDIHLTSLMDKQPSVRRTLRKKVNGGNWPLNFQTSRMSQEVAMIQRQENGYENEDNDPLYVQIEQLYANFCKMHFPTSSVKWMLKLKQRNKLLHSKDDIDVVHDVFARRENSQGYWDVVSVQESLALQKENEELKQKVTMLEAQLEEKERRLNPPRTVTKSPDLTKGVLANMPRQCNVRLSNLKRDSDGPSKTSKQTLMLKTKGFEQTSNSDDSIVAGCPVPIRPDIDCVQPMKMKFEWRISDYTRKLEMERKGQQHRTESNRFYINHNGYLGQVEVYLNGNSTGQGRYMSVFLRIVKGAYDHLLHWPVRVCLVVTLVNQIEGRPESLKGGGDGFSEFEYRKPTGSSDDNADCWGFVIFVSHEMLSERNYLCNDSILLGISLKFL